MQHNSITILPNFKEIDIIEEERLINKLIEKNLSLVEKITNEIVEPTWDSLVYALESVEEELSLKFSVISHLNACCSSDKIRKTYNNILPQLTNLSNSISQNKKLYDLYLKLKNSQEYITLSRSQKTKIDHAIRDFKLGGVSLAAEQKKQFSTLSTELSILSSKFSDNLMDSTDDWELFVEDKDVLSGMLEQDLQLAKNRAQNKGKNGYLLTIDPPTFTAILKHADNRELRQKVHYAYYTRASELSNDSRYDNTTILADIVAKETQLAELLGFSNYADYSLATKMAKSTKEVEEFLSNLVDKAKPQAEKELSALQEYANSAYGIEKLEAWDIAYYSEKLRKQSYDISEEEIKPYFATESVISGMFEVVNKLYGITIEQQESSNVWHESVKFYVIKDRNLEKIGFFYLDLYARSNKRGGAWMSSAVNRRYTKQGIVLPVAFLTTNFTPATSGLPSLLSHSDVETLFHEFGHGLHHLLTKVDVLGVSGIDGVPWDAVELPSQFMENWCWEKIALDLFAKHYDSKIPLSQETLSKMLSAKNYNSAMQIIRQLEFAMFDLVLYRDFKKIGPEGITKLLNKLKEQISVVPSFHYNRFQNSFAHIFSGGYAAGYYSYLWAEVLSQDAYAEFKKNGIFDQETGERFLKNILEKGGSEDMQKIYIDFKGAKQTIDALLADRGLN